jgi:hypothetical protein
MGVRARGAAAPTLSPRPSPKFGRGDGGEGSRRGQGRTAPAFFPIGERLGQEAVAARHFRQGQEVVSNDNPKSVVPVPVVRIVPVAVRTTDVPLIIVERPATQHTLPVRTTDVPLIIVERPATQHTLLPVRPRNLTAAYRAAGCRVSFFQPPSRRPISVTYWAA